uniref:Uncharacterized protein n=1 Tax=Glossina palpalis gambiensis TaxID=67801 RepID=A0A1B0C1N2_9MUSC
MWSPESEINSIAMATTMRHSQSSSSAKGANVLRIEPSNLALTTILKTQVIRSQSLVSYATPSSNSYLYTSHASLEEAAKLGQIEGIVSWSANQQQLLISNNNLQLKSCLLKSPPADLNQSKNTLRLELRANVFHVLG